MKQHWQYLKYLVRHIYFVAYACFRKGIWWRGLLHDISKWRPDEWISYANFFYGKEMRRDSTGYYKPTDTGKDLTHSSYCGKIESNETNRYSNRCPKCIAEAFDFAWLLHQKRNRHHWQFWVLPEDDGGVKILPMPHIYRLEMLCDWWGASMAQGYHGKSKTWYESNKHKMQLHPDTRQWIEENISDDWI